LLQRPEVNEYPEYYVPYVSLVPEGDLIPILQENLKKMIKLFDGISEEDSYYRYGEGKWSIKEVLGHITDTERIMSYRLMRIGRGDKTPLAGFDEEFFVNHSKVNELPVKKILDDFIATRKATITLIENMPTEAWTNEGNANNTKVTTRAIAYILAGHEIHHRHIIEARYLSNLK
jgi:uncharacterized damage-inducible protein DinB